MKVKLGDVGMKEMSIHTIEECFYQIRNGANIKQGVVDGGYPITRIETTANDKFNRDRMGYAGITDIKKYESYVLEDGDLLMSHINSVQYLGRTVLYEKQGDEKIIHGMNLLDMKANRDILKPAYARYYFYSRPFREQVGKITKKSVNQASFAVADLKKIKIKVPDLAVQEEVVEILNRLNCVIEERQQELQKMDELIRARFIELFGDPMTDVSKWSASTIGEQFNVSSGGTPATGEKAYWENGTIPWIGSNMCQDTMLSENDGKFITEEGYAHSSAKWFHKGTVLVALVGATIGKTALLRFDTTTNQNIAAIDVTQNAAFSSEFVFYHMQMLYSKFMEIGSGKFKMANQGFIRQLPLICPPIELQEQFAAFVEQTDKSKATVQKALDETQLLFDSLMQQYFG